MLPQPPLPPLLTPYLALPASSLTVLTSTLEASTSWLVHRFLHAVLSSQRRSTSVETSIQSNTENSHVVFVSWLSDLAFWKDGAKRLGLDPYQSSRVTFVDAMTASLGLTDGGIEDVEKVIQAAIAEAKGQGVEVLLVLDGLDFLLAATETSVEGLLDTVSALREETHSLLLTLSADAPLIHTRGTPLETNHASLVMALAHLARCIIGIRALDTGAAKDVSGVIRAGRGGGEGTEGIEQKEMLYFLMNDGGVRVFERGA